MTREIVFLDANTIWHCRLAEALANEVKVTIVNPQAGWFPSLHRFRDAGAVVIAATLPRGWASRTYFLGQRILNRLILRAARGKVSPPVVVLASPAYAPLAEMLPADFPIVNYTADDYRSYEGWGGVSIAKRERSICHRAAMSIFVSETLRQRALQEFDLDPARTIVSPNATEPRFADRACARPPILTGKTRPIVGVLGALSDRLDLEALASAVSCPAVATFLVAGPADPSIIERYPVFGSEKVVITGSLRHEEMHLYANAMDVGIIPYVRSALNYHCSPMRLYDHLATGVPIVALEGCDQIDRCANPNVTVVPRSDLTHAVETAISGGRKMHAKVSPDLFWESRAQRIVSLIEDAVKDNLTPKHAT